MNPVMLYYTNIASGVLLHRNDSYYDDAQASTLVAATGGSDVLTNKRNNRSNGIGKSQLNVDINSTALNNINSDYNRPSFNTTRFIENSTNAEPYSATNSRVENDEKSLFTPTGSRSTNSSTSHREQPNHWWWSWSTRSNDDDDGRGDIYVENERDNRRLVLEVDKRTTAVTSNSVARHHQSHSHQYYHRQQRFSVAKYQNNFGPQNGVTSSGHNQHDRHNRSSADNNGEMPYVYEWINRLQRLLSKDNVPYKGDIYNNIFNDTTVFYGDNFTTNYSNVTTDNGENFCHPDAIASNVQAVQYISYGICIPIVASIGILVNLASLIVLTRPSMRNSVYMYLAGLSFFDCLLLLLSVLIFPALIYCELACNEHSAWCRYMKATMPFTYPLMNIAQTGSIWTLTAITVDRFVAITWPLKSRDWLTVCRALIVLAVIFIWSVIYNIPLFFELEWQANGQLDVSWLRMDTTYVRVYKIYCYLLFMFVVPAVTMIVLNVFVTLAVRRAYTVRRQLSGRDEKERRCTVMAVLVVGTFLVLNFVANIANCIEAFNADRVLTKSLRPVIYIGNLLVTVNSATNFFIYCALSLRFRQTFCKLFCPVCYTPEKEYQFLSAYFGSGRGNNAAGVDNAGGIISMRSIRRPLISSPRSSLQHHQQQQRTGGSVTRFSSNNNSISNAPGNNDSSPNAFGGSNNNNNNNGSGRKPPMKVDFSQRNKNLVTRRTPIYD